MMSPEWAALSAAWRVRKWVASWGMGGAVTKRVEERRVRDSRVSRSSPPPALHAPPANASAHPVRTPAGAWLLQV